jgi:hypothetical protein
MGLVYKSLNGVRRARPDVVWRMVQHLAVHHNSSKVMEVSYATPRTSAGNRFVEVKPPPVTLRRPWAQLGQSPIPSALVFNSVCPQLMPCEVTRRSARQALPGERQAP